MSSSSHAISPLASEMNIAKVVFKEFLQFNFLHLLDGLQFGKHRRGSKVAASESDATSSVQLADSPFFFLIRADSGQNRPIPMETGTDTAETTTETC